MRSGHSPDKQQQLVVVLEVARIEPFVHMCPSLQGRPPADRHAIARAIVVKAALGLPQTNILIDWLLADKMLRRLCGWEHPGQVPSEATFSRAFAEFAGAICPLACTRRSSRRRTQSVSSVISRGMPHPIETRETPVR
jgi:hypothetical protein